MTRGGGDAKRQLQVLVLSWLLIVSVVGASGIVGASSSVGTSSSVGGGADVEPTTTESPRPLEPRFDFACEHVAVTARGYDSVTLVFGDDDRETFYWSFRGRNVFFGTGENVGAVVAEVVVRRDGERVTRRNPNFEACAGQNATTAAVGTTGGTATAATTGGTATATTTATAATLDLPTTIELTMSATATPATATVETTAREATTAVPTPTVTPQPIAGFPECSDEEFGLERALNLSYADGAFTSENAAEIGENRFRFTVENESYELELVEVERNGAGNPISVTFDATLSVDGVIVRSGSGANVYEFSEGVSRRADLRAPTDENTGQPFVIEEIAFCYDPETPNRTESSGGPLPTLDDLGHGLGLSLNLLVGRGATAAVGLAAAGLLVVRRRRRR